MTTSPPASTVSSALPMVRQGQAAAQLFWMYVSLSTSAPLAETKACGPAPTGEAGTHEMTTARRTPRVTRYRNIVTLLDPLRITGFPHRKACGLGTPDADVPPRIILRIESVERIAAAHILCKIFVVVHTPGCSGRRCLEARRM